MKVSAEIKAEYQKLEFPKELPDKLVSRYIFSNEQGETFTCYTKAEADTFRQDNLKLVKAFIDSEKLYKKSMAIHKRWMKQYF